ncbi:MAG: helix-turn-helix domain-containing protein [Gemmatimonadota bacterium]
MQNQQIICGRHAVREVAYTPGLRQPPHWHAEAGMTLVLGGSIRECVGAREEFGSALSVVVKPAGVRHADAIGQSGARTLQILFDPLVTDCPPYRAVTEGWRWLHAQPVAAAMLALLRAVRAAAAPHVLQDLVTDAVAAIEPQSALTGTPPSWLRRIREAIDDEPESSVTLGELARCAGLHAVSLARAFRRHYGRTLTDYRRAARLRRAAAAIAGSDRTLSRIAYEAGFSDHPHLSREFQLAAGLSPSEFRKITRG